MLSDEFGNRCLAARGDPDVASQREPDPVGLDVREPRIVGDRGERALRLVCVALVHDDQLELRVLVREHALDGLPDQLWSVARADDRADSRRSRSHTADVRYERSTSG